MDICKEPVKKAIDWNDFTRMMGIYGAKMLSYNQDEIIDIKVLDDNNRVVKIGFADGCVVKNVRDEEDVFDIEECLYLAMAKKLYRKEYTYEGILHMMEELKFKKDAVSIVKHGVKVYEEYLEEEKSKKKKTNVVNAEKQRRLLRSSVEKNVPEESRLKFRNRRIWRQ